jgi:ADP-ribosylglycohydrolase
VGRGHRGGGPLNDTELLPEDLFETAEPEEIDPLFPIVAGSLVAGASADALGWPTEFMRSPAALQRLVGEQRMTDYVGWRKTVGGRFNAYLDFIGPGEYSDDTQLTLAVARSLAADGALDNEYFAKRELPAWLAYSRGAGRTITAAAKKAARLRTPWYANFFVDGKLDYRQSGANGAAMRVSPIALAHLRNEPRLKDAFANAIITHGHPRAHMGAVLLVAAVHEAANRRLKREAISGFRDALLEMVAGFDPTANASHAVSQWLREWERTGESYAHAWAETLTEVREQLEPRRHTDTMELMRSLGCLDRATKGSGTSTVAAAIHLVDHFGHDLEGAVVEAVSAIPADTDTIGAFVGAIAGAYAGYEAIPERWTARLQDHGYFISISQALAAFAGNAGATIALRPRILPVDREAPDILELLESSDLAAGLRIRHDVLGAGWVEAVHAQRIRRRGGGEIVYARVALDIGQHVQFRTYVPANAR